MKAQYCMVCKEPRGFKRSFGVGTIFAVMFTGGFWLLALPFYPKRCIACGNEFGGTPSEVAEAAKEKIRLIKEMPRSGFWLIGGIILLFIMVSIIENLSTSPPPKTSPPLQNVSAIEQDGTKEPASQEQMEQILKGKNILKKLNKKYPDSKPIIWGLGVSTGTLTVYIPRREWGKISNEQREELAAYLKYLIPHVRKNPAPFINTTSTAPIYGAFLNRASRLDRWAIGVGRLINVHGEQTIMADEIVYEGNVESTPP